MRNDACNTVVCPHFWELHEAESTGSIFFFVFILLRFYRHTLGKTELLYPKNAEAYVAKDFT